MARLNNQINTVLLVNDASIVRYDILPGESFKVVSSLSLERSESAELGDAVAQAMADGLPQVDHPSQSNVWVLSDEVWSGKIRLPKSVVDAISPDQIQQALGLAAEQESGISAFDSLLSSIPTSVTRAESTWWVTQAEQTQWAAVKAAMPDWARLAGLTAIAASDDLDPPDATDGTSSLDESFALQWLSDQVSDQGAGQGADAVSIPVIVDHKTVDNTADQKRFRLAVAAAVLATFFGLNLYGGYRTSQATDHLSQLVDQEMDFRNQAKRAEVQARRVSKAQQLVESTRESIERRRQESVHQKRLRMVQRQRPTQVLRALLATAGPSHWIQKIRITPSQVLVAGLAVDSAAVTRLTQAMESELGQTRWTVEPAEMHPETEQLIGFELKLTPKKFSMRQVALRSKGQLNVR